MSITMSKNVIVALLDDSDIEQVNVFYNKFNKTNRSISDFIWEFKQAPAGKAIYVIAKDADSNRIVGTQCAIPIYLYTHAGEVVLSAKSEDTLVDPEYTDV